MWDMFAAPETKDDDVPPVYVDKSLLEKAKGLEALPSSDSEDLTGDWMMFELYAEKVKDDGDDSEELYLNITLERVTHGYLINSSLYLTEFQWHTIILEDVSSIICAVCDSYFELCNIKSHIDGEEHRVLLERYKPLRSYDLSVTRKIENKLHCGVCNEVIEETDEETHYMGKTHESNFLFALNKASDIVHNEEAKKKDCYHFTDNAVSSGVNTNRNVTKKFANNENSTNNNDYFGHVSQYTNDNAIEKEREFDLYKEFNMKAEDFVDFYEFEGPSYANIASKPKAIDDLIVIDVNGKKIAIKSDSWHMIVAPKPNVFYCMSCTVCDRIRNKADHILDVQHLEKLNACCMVEKYEEYVVRKVNSNLYHCGFCNNLQFVHKIDDHIKQKHKKSIKNVIEATTTPKKQPQKPKIDKKNPTVKTEKPKEVKETEKKTENAITQNKAKQNTEMNRIQPKNIAPNPNQQKVLSSNHNQQKIILQNQPRNIPPGIFDKIEMFLFGYKMTLSVMAYNVICQRADMKFYCGLCNVICREDVIKLHIHELGHMQRLQNTPFVAPFSCNLIRGIREALHCAICNIPIPPMNIYAHNSDGTHLYLLTQAVGLIAPGIFKNAPFSPCNVPNPNIFNGNQSVHALANGNQYVKPVDGSQYVNNFTSGNQAVNKLTSENQAVNTNGNQAVNTNGNQSFNTLQNDNQNINNLTYVDISHEIPSVAVEKKDSNISIRSSDSNRNINPTKKETKRNVNKTIEDVKDMSLEEAETSEIENVFDFEEFVYVKLRNTFIKITNSSYNTLVPLGDGSRYCFVCSKHDYDLQAHVESRAHLENIEKYRFLDRYEENLMRQIFLMYHCAICNVIVPRKHIKAHLEWPTHSHHLEITEKIRKNDIKNGIKQINVNTQKENIYLNEKETQIKILHHVCVKKYKDFNMELMLGKVVIFKSTVFKISWASYNGISETNDECRCIICQVNFNFNDIEAHVNSEWHVGSLKIEFDKIHDNALIRKISDSTLNCVTCNIELSNRNAVITEHILDKKHVTTYESILKKSAQADTYSDCDENIIIVH